MLKKLIVISTLFAWASSARRLLFVLVGIMLTSQSYGALVTDLNINVSGSALTATFHDFQDDQSFNSLWDGNGDGLLTNDGALDPFDFVPYFWNNQGGAEEARDLIIEALFNCNVGCGLFDWVDESFGNNYSDAFFIPTRHFVSTEFVTLFGDLESDVGDTPVQLHSLRDNSWLNVHAWVTFSPNTTVNVPAPSVFILMLPGLIGLGLMRSPRPNVARHLRWAQMRK